MDGDGDDRPDQPQFDRDEIHTSQPARLVVCRQREQAAHEVLPASEHDDDHEVGDQREIDQGKDDEDGLAAVEREKTRHRLHQLLHELHHHQDQRGEQPDIDRRHDPARGKQGAPDVAAHALLHGADPRNRLVAHSCPHFLL